MTQAGSAAEVLQPYVPRLLVSWLRETPEARHRQIDGTLAFVDISGFTQLTERLARKGKVGSEEISDTLDHCFAQLLSVAYDYGAGVVKWGGDAVLLLFTGDEHAARACRASWGMHEALRKIGALETSAGRVRLRMSVGVHSGSFDFFLTGGLHRDLVLAGPGASETIAMESAADAGETVLSPASVALLGSELIRGPKAGGFLLARAPDARPQRAGAVPDTTGLRLERFFSPAVLEHVLAGETDPGHRMVTAAFVELQDVEELLARRGPEPVADALDEALGNIQEAAARHDVTVFDTDPTPGGAKTMLVAGAPRSTGADDERMLRTLRQVFDRPGVLALRAGVNSGRVFADEFGPYYRRTYTVKGDAVNLAARLMAKAATGQILAGQAVLERSRTAFESEPVEPFHVKGKAQPVDASLVGALVRSDAGSREAPFVGRERELEVLRERLDAASRGDGSVVELVGEPGLGKSSLVAQLCTSAAGVNVLQATGDEYESSAPYHALQSMLRGLLGIDRDASDLTAAKQLEERVASMTPELLGWLPLLAIPLDLHVGSTPEVDRLDDQYRRTQLERVMSEFLGEALRTPTLLVVEDTHWLDAASLDLLRALAREVADRPWLILTTRRPETEPLTKDGLAIALEPLSGEAVEALLHSDEAMPLPAHQLRALAERSGGNPLFLTELIAEARAGGGGALPDSVEALVTAQIDRLTPPDRALLRQAAVLGASFDEDLLVSVLDRDSPPAADDWTRLARFLQRDAKGGVQFRHALIRDAAYEGLPYRQRRELHARVGETVERLAGEGAEREAAQLSLHFFHAQRYDDAWRYSRLAGDSARGVYAYAEAADLYVRALDSARHVAAADAADLAGVFEALGDSLDRLGLFGESGKAYRDARRRRRGDAVAEAGLMLKEGWAAERGGRLSQALRWFSRGLGAVGGVEGGLAGAARAQLLAGYATVRQMQGRSLDAIRWCDTAIEAAAAAKEQRALAQAYYVRDWAFMELGRSGEAVSLPLALRIYEELGDLAHQAVVREMMGVFAYYEGRWDAAVELYGQARDDFEAVGALVLRASDTFNIAEIRCDQGRIDEAEPLVAEALRVWRAAGWSSKVAIANRQLGSVAFRAGRFADALELFERARAAFAEVGAPHELVDTDGRIAECLLAAGDPRGTEVAEEALSRCRALGERSVHMPMLLRVAGLARLQAGHRDSAASALEDSLRIARERDAEFQVALTLDALARLGDERAAAFAAERDAILAELAVVALPPAPARIDVVAVR